MKILVVFGSKSDEGVSAPLAESLKADFEVEHEFISAHRELEKLAQKMAGWQGDAVVAGAGLAAALPGVVAAMTRKPVFGVPVAAQFGGLDSLASIAQMPPGMPVMTCGPDKTESVAAFLKAYKKAPETQFRRINFVACDKETAAHPDLLAEIEKAKLAAQEKGVTLGLSETEAKDAFNVLLVTKPEHVKEGLYLHLPFMPKAETQKPENYFSVFAWARKGGLWVGVNNTRNAVAAVARLQGAAQVAKEKAA